MNLLEKKLVVFIVFEFLIAQEIEVVESKRSRKARNVDQS